MANEMVFFNLLNFSRKRVLVSSFVLLIFFAVHCVTPQVVYSASDEAQAVEMIQKLEIEKREWEIQKQQQEDSLTQVRRELEAQKKRIASSPKASFTEAEYIALQSENVQLKKQFGAIQDQTQVSVKRLADLQERELKLQTGMVNLLKREKQVDEVRAGLLAQIQSLKEEKQNIQQSQEASLKAVAEREDRAHWLEKQILTQLDSVKQKEAEVDSKLAQRDAELSQKEERVKVQEVELKARENELVEAKKVQDASLLNIQQERSRWEAERQKQQSEIAQGRRDLANAQVKFEDKINQQESQIANRFTEIQVQNNELGQKIAEFEIARREISLREKNLTELQLQLAEKERVIAESKASSEEAIAELKALKTINDEKVASLNLRERLISQKEPELSQRELKLIDHEKKVDGVRMQLVQKIQSFKEEKSQQEAKWDADLKALTQREDRVKFLEKDVLERLNIVKQKESEVSEGWENHKQEIQQQKAEIESAKKSLEISQKEIVDKNLLVRNESDKIQEERKVWNSEKEAEENRLNQIGIQVFAEKQVWEKTRQKQEADFAARAAEQQYILEQLEAREKQLIDSEKNLADREKEVEDLYASKMTEIQEKQSILERLQAQLNLRQVEFEQQAKQLPQAVQAKEQEAIAKLSAAQKEQSSLSSLKSAFEKDKAFFNESRKAWEDKKAFTEKQLTDKISATQKSENGLAEREKALKQLSERLESRSLRLDSRSSELDLREKKMKEDGVNLERQQSVLKEMKALMLDIERKEKQAVEHAKVKALREGGTAQTPALAEKDISGPSVDQVALFEEQIALEKGQQKLEKERERLKADRLRFVQEKQEWKKSQDEILKTERENLNADIEKQKEELNKQQEELEKKTANQLAALQSQALISTQTQKLAAEPLEATAQEMPSSSPDSPNTLEDAIALDGKQGPIADQNLQDSFILPSQKQPEYSKNSEHISQSIASDMIPLKTDLRDKLASWTLPATVTMNSEIAANPSKKVPDSSKTPSLYRERAVDSRGTF